MLALVAIDLDALGSPATSNKVMHPSYRATRRLLPLCQAPRSWKFSHACGKPADLTQVFPVSSTESITALTLDRPNIVSNIGETHTYAQASTTHPLESESPACLQNPGKLPAHAPALSTSCTHVHLQATPQLSRTSCPNPLVSWAGTSSTHPPGSPAPCAKRT